MNNNIKKYKELLILIGGNIKNKQDKYFLLNNVDMLATKFNNLSNIISNISNITFDKHLSLNQKITKMSYNLPFTKSESKQLIRNFNLNNKQNYKNSSNTKNNNMQTGGYNILDCIHKKDFKEPLDFIYILLFMLASFPFVIGAFSDFMIICRALFDRRIFLATIVSITLFFSMFTFHMFDMGLIFKILYALDNNSYINYSRLHDNNKNNEDTSLVNDINNEDITVENNTNENDISNISMR